MNVKICGLKTKEQVDHAVNAGADFVGFIFAPSKRQVTPVQVRSITVNVPKRVKKVGVFVSPTKTEVERTVQQAGLDMVQIHGTLPQGVLSVPVIQALSVDEKTNRSNGNLKRTDYLLFDAPPKEFVGGNGETFNWQQLDLKKYQGKKIIIAGGLTVDNVQEAIRTFEPYGVDVSSGVETNDVKDLKKISAFIKKAKEDYYV